MVESLLAGILVLFMAVVLYFVHKELSLLKDYFLKANASEDQVRLDSFNAYLQHIANLEKMVLPSPVKQSDVQRILDMAPVPVVENDIEKMEDEGVPITEQNLAGIPFTAQTKVVIEGGDDFPTEVL